MKEKTFENSSRCRVVFVCVDTQKKNKALHFGRQKLRYYFNTRIT